MKSMLTVRLLAVALFLAAGAACSSLAGVVTPGPVPVAGLLAYTDSDPTLRDSVTVYVGETVYLEARGDGGPNCADYLSYDIDWEGDPNELCDGLLYGWYYAPVVGGVPGSFRYRDGPTPFSTHSISFIHPGIYWGIVIVEDTGQTGALD